MAKPRGVRRDFLLSKDITNESVQEIIEKIMNVNYNDDQLEEDYGDKYTREPIKLFINSYGGSVYDGLALVDAIQYSTTPVYTIALGSAMSMGLYILMSGRKRFMSKNSTLMYHEIGYGVWDKLEEHKLTMKEMERLQFGYDSIITSNTKVTKDKLEDYKTRKAEWYISLDEAVNLGFVDEYKV